jgi:hypothetical protein
MVVNRPDIPTIAEIEADANNHAKLHIQMSAP